MSGGVTSVLNPMSAEAVAVRLGPRAFGRELLLALALSLSLPLVFLAGSYLFHETIGTKRIGLAIAFALIFGLTAMLLIVYASLRLNAATLARERATLGSEEVLVHSPFKGPWLLKRSFVPGSTRSRLLSGLPACVGFGIPFGLMSYATTGSPLMVLHLPLGLTIAVQVLVVASLFQADP
jgi:hypothetical protein